MTDDGSVIVLPRKLNRIEGFGECADLVYLYENGIGHAFRDSFAQEGGVRDKKIVADKLRGGAEPRGQFLPAIPIIFCTTVFDRYDRETSRELFVIIDQLVRRAFRTVGFFEDVSVLIRVIKFRRGRIERDKNLLTKFVARFFHGACDRFQRIFDRAQIGRETAFVADGSGKAARFQHLFQRMKNLDAVTKRLGESRCAFRHDHEFLEVNRRIGVRASIQNVHHRHG